MVWPLVAAGVGGLFSFLGNRQNQKTSEQNARMQMIAQQQANEANIAATERQNALNREMQDRINSLALADKETDRQLQREFAQSGIQWRSQDAREAGIHPIYAIGGQGASYSPSAISVGVPSQAVPQVSPVHAASGTQSWLGNFGQDIGRAINATRTAMERDAAYETSVKAMTLTKMGLENDLLASQIAKLRAGPNPAFPAGSSGSPVPMADKFEDRPRLIAGNGEWRTDPTVANAEDVEKRHGEWVGDVYGAYVAWRDYMHTTNGLGPFLTMSRDWDRLRRKDRSRSIYSTPTWSGSP